MSKGTHATKKRFRGYSSKAWPRYASYRRRIAAPSLIDKLITAFHDLSEEIQAILIIGILLLLAWLIVWFARNPYAIRDILRALQLWFLARKLWRG